MNNKLTALEMTYDQQLEEISPRLRELVDKYLPRAIEDVYNINDVQFQPGEFEMLTVMYKKYAVCFLSILEVFCDKFSNAYPNLGEFKVVAPELKSNIVSESEHVLAFNACIVNTANDIKLDFILFVSDEIGNPDEGTTDELLTKMMTTREFSWWTYNHENSDYETESLKDLYKTIIDKNFISH